MLPPDEIGVTVCAASGTAATNKRNLFKLTSKTTQLMIAWDQRFTFSGCLGLSR
jgi:hypothetical protein